MDQDLGYVHPLDEPPTFTLPEVSLLRPHGMPLERKPHLEAENVPFRIEGQGKSSRSDH